MTIYYGIRLNTGHRLALVKSFVLVLKGDPGCNESVQAARIAEKYGYSHLSYEELLKSEMDGQSHRSKDLKEAEGDETALDVRIALQKCQSCTCS